MKRFLHLICAITLVGIIAKAQTAIVVQTGSSSYVYTSLDAAVTNSSAGSIIYLPGGNFTLNVPINKNNLSIIGAGHHPDSTLETGITTISSTITVSKGSHNLYLDGLYITGDINILYNNRSDNIVIKRCNVNYIQSNGGHNTFYYHDSILSHNLTIWHSVVRGAINAGYLKNIVVRGSIINGQLQYVLGGLFENNIFLKNDQSYNFAEIRNTTFRNNIFMYAYALDYGAYSCWNPPCGTYDNLFLKNIFNGDSATIGLWTNAYLRVQNKYGITNLFVNQSGNTFSYSQNYHLTTTSIANDYGTDGTDCGIYGTLNPFKDGMIPINPHITEVNIAPATNASGQLQIQIKATAQEK